VKLAYQGGFRQAYIADNLDKPMVIGEFGMPVTKDGSGYPV
jgi:hypothetical protein